MAASLYSESVNDSIFGLFSPQSQKQGYVQDPLQGNGEP